MLAVKIASDSYSCDNLKKSNSSCYFHAKYGDYEIIVEINSGIIEGKFPKRALNLVMEWYEIHKDDLMQDWELIRTTGDFNKIQPLE